AMPQFTVARMTLLPDGKTMVLVGSEDNFPGPSRNGLQFLDVASGKVVRKLNVPPAAHVGVSRDGSLLAILSEGFGGGSFRLVEAASGKELFVKEKLLDSIGHGAAITADNKYVVATGHQKRSKIFIWNLAGEEQRVVADFAGNAESIAVSGSGHLLAA